jgi:hypothetical protein
MRREDIARFDRALHPVAYPARKWQLIAYAGWDHSGAGARTP